MPIQMRIFMFKFQSAIKTSITENLDYLGKTLYGLKQVGRPQYYEISGFINKIELIQYNTNNCLFGKYKNNKLSLKVQGLFNSL